MTTSRVAALAAMVMSAPMVAAFAPSGVPMGLQQRAGAISRAASAIPTLRTPASRCTLRMQEEVAGVSEVSDQEQRSLDKTRTNKRPRSDNKNKKPLTDYTVGEMTKGKVVSIMPYGAFVDVGTTTDGLVHVSQIADEFVSDIESVVKVGQEVECRIVSVDTDKNKISLSMRSENAKPAGGGGGGGRGKRAELPEEFKNFDDQKFIPGKVRGHPAARDPRPPLLGSAPLPPTLCRVAEPCVHHGPHRSRSHPPPSTSATHLAIPDNAPSPANLVVASARVVFLFQGSFTPLVDPNSLRVALPRSKSRHDPNKRPTHLASRSLFLAPRRVQVASVMDYGCFVTIAEGIEALVHVSEMAEERVSKPDAVVKVGQDVQVRAPDDFILAPRSSQARCSPTGAVCDSRVCGRCSGRFSMGADERNVRSRERRPVGRMCRPESGKSIGWVGAKNVLELKSREHWAVLGKARGKRCAEHD